MQQPTRSRLEDEPTGDDCDIFDEAPHAHIARPNRLRGMLPTRKGKRQTGPRSHRLASEDMDDSALHDLHDDQMDPNEGLPASQRELAAAPVPDVPRSVARKLPTSSGKSLAVPDATMICDRVTQRWTLLLCGAAASIAFLVMAALSSSAGDKGAAAAAVPHPAVPPAPPLPSPDSPPPPWGRWWWKPSPPPPPSSPPLPPSPPPPLGVDARLELLNSRWANGHPTNDLVAAGVLLHTFDAMDAGRDDVWNACPDDSWCGRYNDRWSVSLINKRLPSFFRGSGQEAGNEPNAGFVLDSSAMEPAAESISCAWAIDGGTLGVDCTGQPSTCIPGCRDGFECGTGGVVGDYCWWGVDRLQDMLEQQERLAPHRGRDVCFEDDCKYNELIIGSRAWARTVPWLIAAVYFPRGSLRAELRARAVHSALLRAFPYLRSSTGTPLLRYDGLWNSNHSVDGPAFTHVALH